MFSLDILRHKNFRNYFTSDIISGFGNGMNFIGGSWLVLQTTGSSAAVGLLLSISLLSGLIAFPFAGTIADRFNRRDVIFWSNLVRAFFITLVAVSFYGGFFRIEYLYFLSVCSGIGWTIFIPASRGLVHELLDRNEFIKGNSLIEISMQVGMITAAAAAGIIYKYFGYGAILAVDATTFVVSNIFLRRVLYQPVVAEDKDHGFIKRFANGFKYLTGNPMIFLFGIAMYIPFIATMSSNVVLPAYVGDHLGKDSVIFGIADMSYGVGACLSGFLAGWVVSKMSRFSVLITFFFVSTIALLLLVANKFVAGLYFGMFAFGLCNSSIRIVMNSVIMETVPKQFMGRAMSVWMAISLVVQSMSVYGVGLFMDRTGAIFGCLWLAVIMAIGLIATAIIEPRLEKKTVKVY